jgi:hypothetical protein
MKEIIKKLLREVQENEQALTGKEILMFKYLDKKGSFKRSGSELDKIVADALDIFNLDNSKTKYYSAFYKLNHLENGDYKNLTKADLKDPQKYHPQKVTNKTSGELAKSKLPFNGSNLKARWETDYNGVEYYVITSYNWYPIYLFKENRWYEIMDNYSSSTSKQIRNSNPLVYDEEIGYNVILVTHDEMLKLKRNATYEDIMKYKVEKLMRDKSKFISDKSKLYSTGRWSDTPMKIRFKVTDIKQENDEIIINVLIDDAGQLIGQKMQPSKGEYLRGSLDGITKEKVEDTVKSEIKRNISSYIGTMFSKITPDMENKFRFEFKHIHEK